MERVCIFLLVCCFGCSPRVIHYLNETAPYGSFETFQITNLKTKNADLSDIGREIIDNIETSIISEMKRRDYRAQKDPHLVVRYELISNQQTDVNVNNMGMFNPMFNPMFPFQNFNVRTFLESALLIEIINLKNNKAIWHASVDMKDYRREKKMDLIIAKAVTNIFNTYPYKAGSRLQDQSIIVK